MKTQNLLFRFESPLKHNHYFLIQFDFSTHNHYVPPIIMDNQKEREILRESPTNFAEIVTIKTMSSSSLLQQSFAGVEVNDNL